MCHSAGDAGPGAGAAPGVAVKLHQVVDLPLGGHEHARLGRRGGGGEGDPVPGGRPRRAVHVDRLRGAELEVAPEDLLRQLQPVRARPQQLELLAGGPEEDVLVAELLLQELGELAQPDAVAQQTVEVLGPAGGPARGLEILLNVDIVQVLLTVQGQAVQALGVRDADLHVLLKGSRLQMVLTTIYLP